MCILWWDIVWQVLENLYHLVQGIICYPLSEIQREDFFVLNTLNACLFLWIQKPEEGEQNERWRKQ